MTKIINAEYLEFHQLKKYYRKKFKEYKLKDTTHLIEDTLDLLKSHSYYSQWALQQIYRYQGLFHKGPTLDQLIDKMLANEYSYLKRRTWTLFL